MSKQKIIKKLEQAVKKLKRYLENERMALIGFYGGFEGTFRDILATELQNLLGKVKIVLTEKRYRDNFNNIKWADIVIIDSNNTEHKIRDKQQDIIIEMKHNYINDRTAINNNIENYRDNDIILVQIINEVKFPEVLRIHAKRGRSETQFEDYQENQEYNVIGLFVSKYISSNIECRIGFVIV